MDGGLKVVAGGHLYRQVRPCHCRAFSTAMVAKTLPFSCVSTAMSTCLRGEDTAFLLRFHCHVHSCLRCKDTAFVAKALPSLQRHCLRGKETAFVAKTLASCSHRPGSSSTRRRRRRQTRTCASALSGSRRRDDLPATQPPPTIVQSAFTCKGLKQL